MLPQSLTDRLRYVEIFTTRTVRNHRAGDYRSRIRGRSFEFDEHKPYQPGDDTRQIDWNLTARMHSPFVKRELEEKELGAIIMVDLSRSMLFTSLGRTKRDLAVETAAALAFSAVADNMNVGLLAFTDRVECYHPPKRGNRQAWRLIDDLYNRVPSRGQTSFGPALELLSASLKHTALVFCLSDFIAAESFWNSRYLTGILHRADFVPVILEDPWEEALPQTSGYIRFSDLEQGGSMVLRLTPAKNRQYERILKERRDQIRERIYRLGLEHVTLRTDDDSVMRLMTFLMSKKRRRR
jgi:uncharacterized protein (DUF58 family)